MHEEGKSRRTEISSAFDGILCHQEQRSAFQNLFDRLVHIESVVSPDQLDFDYTSEDSSRSSRSSRSSQLPATVRV